MSDSGKPLSVAGGGNYEAPTKQSNNDVAALFTNLKLQHGHYQPFTRRQSAKILPQISEPPAIEPVAHARTQIGIFSPAGGSGKSLLVAGIGSVLCQKGKRVLLVDVSPWPSLAFHFGATETRSGRRTFFAPGLQKNPIHLLYCGEGKTCFPDLTEFSASIPIDYVLFDLSGVSGDQLLSYLSECDRVLVPLLPDPSAVRIAAAVVSLIESLGTAAPQFSFILNNMDDSAASKEVHEALIRSLGTRLLPAVILNQPEVRKALQDGVVLPFHVPEAQASLVLGELALSLAKPEKVSLAVDSRWIEG